MLPVVTPEEAKKFDRRAVSALSASAAPTYKLMENAGTALFQELSVRFAPPARVFVACGSGNNGGDGYAVAALLAGSGYGVDVFELSEPATEDAAFFRNQCLLAGVRFVCEPEPPYAAAVDALFGTGLCREVTGRYRDAVNALNALPAYIVSADIPSGIDGLTGRVLGTAVRANLTVTFAAYKYGLLLGDGRDYAGEIAVRDIGVDCGGNAFVTDAEFCRTLFPKRKINSHKGTYGRAAVVAGSRGFFGAGELSESALAALLGGAGYCYLLCPEETASLYRLKNPEVIVRGLHSENGAILPDEEGLSVLREVDALAIGMGLTPGRATYDTLCWALKTLSAPVVVDADALNALAVYGAEVLKETRCSVILTPHPGEFQRLLHAGTLPPDLVSAAKAFAKDYRVTLLLKGATSLVTDGTRVLVNTAGSPALAKGGSGDVLSGVITALLARGIPPLEAAAGGAYVFGKAGERAARERTEYAALASDVVALLPETLGNLLKNTEKEV